MMLLVVLPLVFQMFSGAGLNGLPVALRAAAQSLPLPAADVVEARAAQERGSARAWQPASVPAGPTVGATVLQAVSGDTVDLYFDDGRSSRVRLLGVDSPDLESGCFGLEASEHARGLLNGQRVLVERDTVDADSYGMPLRYLWKPDGVSINELLVGEGYARAAVDEGPPLRLAETLRAAEAAAQREARGLWLACSAG